MDLEIGCGVAGLGRSSISRRRCRRGLIVSSGGEVVVRVVGVGDGRTAAAVRCYGMGACVVQCEGCTHRSMLSCRSVCGSIRVEAGDVRCLLGVVVFVVMCIQSGRCDGEKRGGVYSESKEKNVTDLVHCGERRVRWNECRRFFHSLFAFLSLCSLPTLSPGHHL